MEKFYVYLLKHNKEIFYVGKGSGNRLFYHEKCVKKGINPNNNTNLFDKICSILNNNESIEYNIVFRSDDEPHCYKIEKSIIKKIGLNNLCNLTYGTYIKKDLSKRVSLALKKSEKFQKALRSDERRKKLRLANLGEKNPMYGKKLSKEHIESIKQSLINKPKTIKHKNKISNALKKHVRTEDHNSNLKNAIRNSEKHRLANKNPKKRKKISDSVSKNKNPNAKIHIIISPDNKQFFVKGQLEYFCKDYCLNLSKMCKFRDKQIDFYDGWECYKEEDIQYNYNECILYNY
jgi:hypothetical protein